MPYCRASLSCLLAGLLATCALAMNGCFRSSSGSPEAAPPRVRDPKPATETTPPARSSPAPAPLLLASDVDGSLDLHVGGDRARAEYSAEDPWLGAALPTVTLVAFMDYQCPYSKQLQPLLYELLALYPEDVRVVVKHYPLPTHSLARPAAIASEAARRQGRFWLMHDALFEGAPRLDRAALLNHAGRLGLDLSTFEAALDDPEVARKVEHDTALATALEARGTPSVFINGRQLRGSLPLERLREEIAAELEIARRLLLAGASRHELYAHYMHAAPPVEVVRPGQARREIDTSGLPRRGAADPRVVIVECADFDCPHCVRVLPELGAVLKAHPDDVALLFRHMPLSSHERAEPAARAAVAAQDQGKFWVMHDMLLANPTQRSDKQLAALARRAGLDVARWRESFRSPKTARRVADQAKACLDDEVAGVPTFHVNGREVVGPLEAAVREELARPRG